MNKRVSHRVIKILGFVLFCIGLWLLLGNYSDNNPLLLTGIACMMVGGITFVVTSFPRDRDRSSNEREE